MNREKIKLEQYRVRGKHREFSVIVFPEQEYMWAYYEGFDGEYEIDGDLSTYRLLKFAMAILAHDPHVIIYLPVRNRILGDHAWGKCYDAVLCRPELQLRRSEWIRLRHQLNDAHRVEKYVLQYDAQKLCNEWEKIEHSPARYRIQKREKQEVRMLQDDTVFFVFLKETCLQYHSSIVVSLREGVPTYSNKCKPTGGLGWVLFGSWIREMEEEIKKHKTANLQKYN